MKKESLLWKLEGSQLPAPSYLFGSMHVRDARAFRQLAAVLGRIDDCDAFAAEFHLDDAGQGIEGASMQLPDGQLISQFFPKNKYKRYRNILLKTTGLDIAVFDSSLPFLVVNLVSESLLQTDMPEALDAHLWSYAKASGKSLHGIETLREQMEVLQQISLEEQLKMLASLCKKPEKFRQYLLRLTDLYEAGEVAHIYNMVKKNSKGMRQLMLYSRNEVMAERIAELVQERSAVVAIGAAHLGGAKGVLRLLKKKGLVLKPIFD